MTMIAGVIGWPVAHSRSPLLHDFWIKRAGVDAAYLPFAVSPDRFEAAARGLAGLGLRGANVTLPHKERALAIADRASAAATAIGAANMLTVEDDGSISADNSDAYGFLAHLQDMVDVSPNALTPALVVGAGGVARAALHALAGFGVDKIWIANRTRARAEVLADAFPGVAVAASLDEAAASARLIVNATSMGMDGSSIPLDVSSLRADPIVYDTVYTPLETPLLRQSRAAGARAVDGLGMLMHQARAGAKRWFGIDASPDAELRRILERSFA